MPSDTANSTFCIWRRAGDAAWRHGPLGADVDGSEELLGILVQGPAAYVEFARDYYEEELELADVAAVYRHALLTQTLVGRLNPEVAVEDLAEDVAEIGYPSDGRRGGGGSRG